MCLAIPAKIEKIIDKDHGIVNFNGVKTKTNLSLIDSPKEKEWVTIHAGFAIEKLEKQDAQEILKLLKT